MFEDFISLFQTAFYIKVWHYAFILWPVWLPLISISLFLSTLLTYKRRNWIRAQGSVLLEIKIPKEVARSPAAMEFVLQGIWEPVGSGTLAETFLEGKVRDWFSLEIVSIGGVVKFFIWTLPRWRKIIESRIYAQYPGAEIHEAEDYAIDLAYDPPRINAWGITTKLNKADAFPIRTYIDYELDKKPGDKQEEIVDPITPVIEFLGSLKSNEIAGIQILIQAHRKEGLIDARIIPKDDWSSGMKKAIQEMIEKEAIIEPDKEKPANLLSMSKHQTDTINAIQRNAGKLAFDTMIRCLYVAPTENYEKTRGMGIIGSTRQFGSFDRNGIRPDKFMSTTYPWEDVNNMIKKRLLRTHIDAYKRRSFFNVPHKHLHGKPYVLSTEELATVFHFPGTTSTTPTLTRVPSKKAEAPANLPV